MPLQWDPYRDREDQAPPKEKRDRIVSLGSLGVRTRAILGSAAILAAIGFWGPTAGYRTSSSNQFTCTAMGAGNFCDAMEGLSRVAAIRS
jgi:hypothetical protein